MVETGEEGDGKREEYGGEQWNRGTYFSIGMLSIVQFEDHAERYGDWAEEEIGGKVARLFRRTSYQHSCEGEIDSTTRAVATR